MKITIRDNKTEEVIRIYHDPTEVIEKPKAKILKVQTECADFDEYKLVKSNITQITDEVLDIKEYLFEFFVERVN